jgi:hypothetical protein
VTEASRRRTLRPPRPRRPRCAAGDAPRGVYACGDPSPASASAAHLRSIQAGWPLAMPLIPAACSSGTNINRVCDSVDDSGGTISGAGADASGSAGIGWAGPLSLGHSQLGRSARPVSAGRSRIRLLRERRRVCSNLLGGPLPGRLGRRVTPARRLGRRLLGRAFTAVFLVGLSAAEATPNSGACSIVGASGADDGGPAARLAARRRRGLD